jgi:hypothetical protein
MSTIQLDYSKISNVELDGIDHADYPDYCDAYIVSADYGDREMTDEEIEVLNDDSQFVHEAVWNHIF